MAKKTEKLTPAMKQFHHFKNQHPDAVLFFRMGDFYETFYQDAEICAKVLGLTLTSRNKNSDNPVPLAGVPFHAVDGYIKKMIQAGYKVAVCEQVEDPKTAKGVVKRDVVRIITPGTLTDDMLLDAKEDNFLCAISLDAQHHANISWVDISTGHFYVQQVPEHKLVDELIRLNPKECLVADCRGELFESDMRKLITDVTNLTRAIVTERPGWYFDAYQAQQRLLKHFGTQTLEGFGLTDRDKDLIPAAGAVLEYLSETQKTALGHIQSLRRVNPQQYLQVDPTSLRSLEVLFTMRGESRKGSLLHCLDQTQTGMGGRMFRTWLCMPLYDLNAIIKRQDSIAELSQAETELNEMRSFLAQIWDIERIAARVSTFRASPRDLLALARTLRQVPQLKGQLQNFGAALLGELAEGCDCMEDLADTLEAGIEPECPTHLRDGGVIRAGFDSKLDELRGISKDGQSWVVAYQKEQIERTGIANLKVGYNKVFGYYIEINRALADQVPPDYVRKQTIKNAERYITDQLKTYEEQVLGAEEKALAIELKLFEQLRRLSNDYVERLQKLADVIAQTDCLTSLAYLARRRGYVRPVMTEGNELLIRDGKHPVLAESLGAEFVPNDIELGCAGKLDLASSGPFSACPHPAASTIQPISPASPSLADEKIAHSRADDGVSRQSLGSDHADIMVITGPNMSGKSTYIRQTALLVLLAQTGSFIPAAEATIGLVDRIFTRVGASDELTRGQSTFMVEMTETANIVNNATSRSLVILDEVGRGTSTYDGLSLAWAITEHLATHLKSRTLFATHYHELTELSELFTNIKNCNVAVREWAEEVVFLHRILPGGTDKSYGIHVAKLAGLPASILNRSKEILADLEATFQKEATGEHLAKHKTRDPDSDTLFVQKNKSVLDRLSQTDINHLTPMEAINLLHDIKSEIG